jgi:hypothetical protein
MMPSLLAGRRIEHGYAVSPTVFDARSGPERMGVRNGLSNYFKGDDMKTI